MSNVVFKMVERGIYIEGNVTTVWDTQPTDRVANGKSDIACKIDTQRAAELHKRFQDITLQPKLQVLIGDILMAELSFFDVCIAVALPDQVRLHGAL
ncbi:uncharacterized protein Dana_GF27734 [Drosophila ananassae]|uniref:Uncharacterized protein n=1 Tax=Drosophila ananassae TaxID=7217 RepID=A0A0P8YNR7_DROAN|nr:uncharacterized protein Dana_GF27734 [Drosophila ananassae]